MTAVPRRAKATRRRKPKRRASRARRERKYPKKLEEPRVIVMMVAAVADTATQGMIVNARNVRNDPKKLEQPNIVCVVNAATTIAVSAVYHLIMKHGKFAIKKRHTIAIMGEVEKNSKRRK